MPVDYETLKKALLMAATKCAGLGPGYSQENSVLDEIKSEFGGNMHSKLDLNLQQSILTCWHDLFREGALSWGLNLDNPGPPFFHIPERSSSQDRQRQ